MAAELLASVHLPRQNTPSFVQTNHKSSYQAIDPTQAHLSAAGKTVLITGGATGIGYAIARSFAAANASTIVLLARRANTLDAAKDTLTKAFPKVQVLTFPVDITDAESVKKVFASVADESTNHSLDVLVTSAVFTGPALPALQIPAEDLRTSFETNVLGNIGLVKEFVAAPSKSSKTIIDVSTEGVVNRFPTTGAYGASKYGFTYLLRHAQNDDPTLKIHSFHPGTIYTPMVEGFGVPKEVLTDFVSDVELPGDFAVWLASAESDFLRGRFVFAKWDVEDLKANKDAFEKDPQLATIQVNV